MAAAAANFPYEMSRSDADVDAAGEAVCAIKGQEIDQDAALAAYDLVIVAVPGAKKAGLLVDDSETLYNILYEVYCPGK